MAGGSCLNRIRNKKINTFSNSNVIKSRSFYEKMGFEPFGEEFLEAGIKHINMKLKNTPKRDFDADQ
ncbi:MAG: GNAT family N-acetyltransferase [Planctomycetota bacterium]